jgi:hypothetical protein
MCPLPEVSLEQVMTASPARGWRWASRDRIPPEVGLGRIVTASLALGHH